MLVGHLAPSSARPLAIAGLLVSLMFSASCRYLASYEAAAEDPTGPVPPPRGKPIDLLFVVDNSGSMATRQVQLAVAFPRLIDALRSPSLSSDGGAKPCTDTDTSGCNIPDLRIGVITTDLGTGSYSLPSCEEIGGDDGKLQSTSRDVGCTPPVDPWIAYDKDSRLSNVPEGAPSHIERIKAAFSCIARVGAGGCGYEQPLEASRRALDPQLAINPGFLRPEAVLAVIYTTDEDDCSAAGSELFDPSQQGIDDPLGPLTSFRCFEFGVSCDVGGRALGPRTDCVPHTGATSPHLNPIEDYITFFRQLKPPGHVVFGAIVGPPSPVVVGSDGKGNPVVEPSCVAASGVAKPAIRIHALLESFWSFTGSVCGDQDFSETLQRLGALLAPAR